MTDKKEFIIVADYSDSSNLSVAELCEICHLSMQALEELVSYDIVRPPQSNKNDWQFDQVQLIRIKKALRMQHDLEVNLAGVALALDLMDQLDDLREQLAVLQKNYR